jgi:glycopeptide antibiotics resistance protein
VISGAGPLPWFLPGLVVSLVGSLAASGRVARALGVPWLVACVMLLSFGIILSATLTPLRWAFDISLTGERSCDLSRIGLAPLADYLARSETDAGGNVLLFIPLGFAIGMVPRSWRKVAVIVAAIPLPFAIETIQLLAPALDRSCESADVIDNLLGLVIGLAAGTLAGRLAPGVLRRRRGPG